MEPTRSTTPANNQPPAYAAQLENVFQETERNQASFFRNVRVCNEKYPALSEQVSKQGGSNEKARNLMEQFTRRLNESFQGYERFNENFSERFTKAESPLVKAEALADIFLSEESKEELYSIGYLSDLVGKMKNFEAQYYVPAAKTLALLGMGKGFSFINRHNPVIFGQQLPRYIMLLGEVKKQIQEDPNAHNIVNKLDKAIKVIDWHCINWECKDDKIQEDNSPKIVKGEAALPEPRGHITIETKIPQQSELEATQDSSKSLMRKVVDKVSSAAKTLFSGLANWFRTMTAEQKPHQTEVLPTTNTPNIESEQYINQYTLVPFGIFYAAHYAAQRLYQNR